MQRNVGMFSPAAAETESVGTASLHYHPLSNTHKQSLNSPEEYVIKNGSANRVLKLNLMKHN